MIAHSTNIFSKLLNFILYKNEKYLYEVAV